MIKINNNNRQILIISNIKKSIYITYLERKLIHTNFSIKKYKKNCFFIKKNFLLSLCIIHITKKKEMKIIVINTFLKPIIINPFEKLLLIGLYYDTKIQWKESMILNKSKRGNKSFGSTGI
ncbi:hypothetical protein [Blattabacterium cuenoti]|uniref:hypothetical protein n=1 Tax=Blattabacterium cuenoti TaxID=1653831 RepID=UPI001EEA760F|nr:hypothetical protein [Blattabacterium cuenoti]